MSRRALCVDVGSTYTKAALVELDSGVLLGVAAHPTTLRTDVLEGFAVLRDRLGAHDSDEVRACSSAGGGLRLAVVGYERAVTAEAGYRVGLSAGARVVHVAAGRLDRPAVDALLADRPDVLLLAGGTDGGNAEVLLHNAARLARSRLAVPVVVAGNVEARDEVVACLGDRGKTAITTANVLPRIGELDPRPAREAIREVFIRHVIGGKHLSRSPDFTAMVRAATPDAVLSGVELLADGAGDVPGVGDVLVVDVGGATTDVYSVVIPEGEDAALRREVVEVLWRSRTVEGDLGVRWNAAGILAAAEAERLLDPAERSRLEPAACRRVSDPAYLPTSADERACDVRLAQLAMLVALRRHARASGKSLRAVRLLVGSGGALRAAEPEAQQAVLASALSDHAGAWTVPEGADAVVDGRYVLAAAGLLAPDHAPAAARLLAATLRRP